MFIRISRETMLLLINNLHKNVRDNCSFNLRVYSEHKLHWQSFPGFVISHYITLTA